MAAVSILTTLPVQLRAAGLSITNYQVVSQQSAAGKQSYVTYRANLLNAGSALSSVTAQVSTLDPFTVRVVPGQDALQFSPVLANTQVTSLNTFTILIDSSVPFDPSKLQWTFEFDARAPVANPGANRKAAVGSQVSLNGSASTSPTGDALSYKWTFASRPAGSFAILIDTSNVLASFAPDVQGAYVVTLTVSNGAGSSSANVTISTVSDPPPVANAGANQTVSAGSKVTLNGSASTSSGGPLTYNWTLVTLPIGSMATITDGNSVSPSFVADKAGNYVAQLVVNDGALNSAPSSVTISTFVSKPVANAGLAQVVSSGSSVQLNGAGSTDAGGKTLTYRWSLLSAPPGSGAVLNSLTIVNPVFTADLVGTYVAQLIVNNGVVDSDPATVMITTTSIARPTANAGLNQSVAVNGAVQLNGSGTDPQNLPLTFLWTLVVLPTGSHAVLSNASIANPTFVADVAGDFIAQLVVNNGSLNSLPSTVTISTSCAPPVSNAGPNQSVRIGAAVTLDGSGSGPACRGFLTYLWSVTTRPNGSTATLSSTNSAFPSFIADTAGTYVVQLIVNNGVNSNPSTVSVVASAGSGITIPDGLTIGQYLQVKATVSIGAAAPAGGLDILLKANNYNDQGLVNGGPKLLLISRGQTEVGSDFIKVTIPAGASSAPFYLQAQDGVGSVTYTASAQGLASTTATIQLAPAGLVIAGPQGFTTDTPVGIGAGSVPLTVYTAQLDPSSYNFAMPQDLAAGFSVNVSLQNSNSAVGTVQTPVAITGGSGLAVAQFLPQSQGSTTITILRTPLFVRAGSNTSVTLHVSQ